MSRLHLNVNVLHAGVFGGAWRLPDTDPLAAYTVDHYVRIARKAEEGRLDAVFFADSTVLDPNPRWRTANHVEPTAMLARLSALTERIGLIGTLSSSYNDPVELARRLGDLDYVSGGRFGWNVVTTAGEVAARNFGRDAEPDHGLRYERAAELTARVVASWASRTALVSPQGRPVVVQAGGSANGKRLAARIGEVVFSGVQKPAAARRFRDEIRAGAVGFGRRADDVVVLPGLSTVIGGTEAEAKAREAQLNELLPTPYARGRLEGQLGISLAEVADDEPIPVALLVEPEAAGGVQTFYRILFDIINNERPTLGELLRRLGGGMGHRIVVGAPEQIADHIERWHRAGAADGFNVMPDHLPSGLDAFVDHVVPELQRRGLFRREYEGTTLRDHLGLVAAA